MALSWTLDKIGPLCRSAEDCALVLQVIAGKDVEDPGSAGKSFTYTPQFVRKPQEITVGYAPVDFEEWPQPETRAGLQAALEVIKGLGVKMKEVTLPEFPYGALVGIIIAGEAGSIFEDFIRSGKVDELADSNQAAGLKAALELPAVEYLRAMRVRRLVQEALNKLFLDVDLLLAPSRMDVAPSASEPLDGGPPRPRPSSRGLNGLIPAGNLAGLPALSLPCGLAGGLPIGISLVSRPFYENQLISIGRAFQAKTDWHRARPPVGA
jgi:aspartyl-tRNA(Asn)/glutamyl-tRNA(Gln) amidotransferase subunit A